MNNELDLCSLIERNGAYVPDKTAIHFEGQTLSYVSLNRQTERIARLQSQLAVQRGDRIAILSFSRPNYLGMQWSMRREIKLRSVPHHGAASSALLHHDPCLIASKCPEVADAADSDHECRYSSNVGRRSDTSSTFAGRQLGIPFSVVRS
ncbi:AMP-binding protein [Bradyrhizobium sp. USDA 4354]